MLGSHLVEEEVTAVPFDWDHAPDQEGALEDQVEGEGVAQGVQQGVGQELQEGEDPEDDPVPQPGRRLVCAAGEDSLERGESWVDDAHQGAGDESVEVHRERRLRRVRRLRRGKSTNLKMSSEGGGVTQHY